MIKVKLKMDSLTSLEELSLCCEEVSFCEGVCLPPNLQSILLNVKQRTTQPITELGLQGLTALSRLKISADDDIVINTLMKESLLPISLSHLELYFKYQKKAFDVSGLRHLSSLEYLEFNYCEQLESLLENYLPSSLKTLRFNYCEQLESLPENCFPSSLKTLHFWSCKRLESLPEDSLPDSLEELIIGHCHLLEEMYKRKEHWTKIERIPFIDINNRVTMW
jgi:hypothetical protein